MITQETVMRKKKIIDITSIPRSRAEALRSGNKYYYTGKPCKNGHISYRHARSSICPECSIAWEDKRARSEPGFYSKNTIRYRKYRVTNAKHYWEKEVLGHAKRRAHTKGIPFDLSVEDVKSMAPTHCPVLGLELSYVRGDKTHVRDYSPSLDRLIPERGYVKDNVIVVSYRANSIRQNATTKELKLVADFYSSLLGDQDD